MNRGLLILLIGGAMLALGCSSDDEEVERELVYHDSFPVPLETLAGTYAFTAEPQDDPPRLRSSEFAMPEAVADFSRLSLVVEGSWTPGSREIEYNLGGGDVIHDTLAVHGRLQFELTIPVDPEKTYYAVVVPLGEAFYVDVSIVAGWSGGQVNAEDLLGVDLEATLSCAITLGENERLLEPSFGTVTAARLELGAADVYEKSDGFLLLGDR